MTPDERAELVKLEDIAEQVSRQYWQYIEKIARPIKGGKAGQDAFLSLLTIRAYEAFTQPVPKRLGRPPKDRAA